MSCWLSIGKNGRRERERKRGRRNERKVEGKNEREITISFVHVLHQSPNRTTFEQLDGQIVVRRTTVYMLWPINSLSGEWTWEFICHLVDIRLSTNHSWPYKRLNVVRFGLCETTKPAEFSAKKLIIIKWTKQIIIVYFFNCISERFYLSHI